MNETLNQIRENLESNLEHNVGRGKEHESLLIAGDDEVALRPRNGARLYLKLGLD